MAGGCCPPKKKEVTPPISNGTTSERDTYEVVSEYYGRVLATSKDLKTGACTAGGAPPLAIRKVTTLVMSKPIQEISNPFCKNRVSEQAFMCSFESVWCKWIITCQIKLIDRC